MMAGYVYDLAQLIHQQKLAPVTLIGHSLGGNIALRYAGLYPENVARLVAIEGLGPSPKMVAERYAKPASPQRMRDWIDEQRGLSGRLPRRYASIEEAYKRMQEENKHLSAEQARHLTLHGVNQNEDGTYSWKFDNYVRFWPPYDMTIADVEALWARHRLPDLARLRQGELGLQPRRRRPHQAFPQRRGRELRARRPLGPPRPARRVHGPHAPVSRGLGCGLTWPPMTGANPCHASQLKHQQTDVAITTTLGNSGKSSCSARLRIFVAKVRNLCP